MDDPKYPNLGSYVSLLEGKPPFSYGFPMVFPNPWASPAAQSHLRVPWPPAADAAPAPRWSRGWPRPLQSAPGAAGSARMGRFLMGISMILMSFSWGFLSFCVFLLGISRISTVL